MCPDDIDPGSGLAATVLLTLSGTETLLFPGRWKVPALQGTLPEASVRQARHQVQEGGGPTWVPASGRSREQ